MIEQSDMLNYCERCNSDQVEHICEDCGQTTCHDCFAKECYDALTEVSEIKNKMWLLHQRTRAIRKELLADGFTIHYYEGYEQDDIISRWYTSYAWIVSKDNIKFEIHQSCSRHSVRAIYQITIWNGDIPDLNTRDGRYEYVYLSKVRVLSYLEDMNDKGLIAHLNKIHEALT